MTYLLFIFASKSFHDLNNLQIRNQQNRQSIDSRKKLIAIAFCIVYALFWGCMPLVGWNKYSLGNIFKHLYFFPVNTAKKIQAYSAFSYCIYLGSTCQKRLCSIDREPLRAY